MYWTLHIYYALKPRSIENFSGKVGPQANTILRVNDAHLRHE